jgi:hypothetical protein
VLSKFSERGKRLLITHVFRWGFLNPKGISAQSPGLARRAYPGKAPINKNSTPTGLRLGRSRRRNPVGVETVLDPTSQGSSCLATLGFVAESLWDSANTSAWNLWVISSAHSRPAKQMDTIELAQFCACARRCAARAPTTKATAPATTSGSKQIIERRTRMRRRAAYKSADESSFFTSANLLMANSRSSREWAAETCVRMRALPLGTTG